MTYVVIGHCEDCRYTDCATVCPVDCFHGDERMLYIDPNECIDCGACVPECPVNAIFPEDEVPAAERAWTKINAERAPGLPVVNDKVPELPSAAEKRKRLGL
jgi:ferredoxin